MQERWIRTGAQVQLEGAGPNDDGPLSVNDDPRARALVHAHKLAHARNDIRVMDNVPGLRYERLVLPAQTQ